MGCPPTRANWTALLAELIGMTLFVFVGVGVAHQQFRAWFDYSGDSTSLLTISLAFGLGITCFVCMCAGPSGGHLNPAVTCMLMALGEISVPLGFLYILAQMVGATIGALLAACADPYLAGFAVNTIAKYKCGGTFGPLGNLSDCCERFDCNVTGSSLYNTALDPEDYFAQLDNVGSPTGPYTTATLQWGPAFVVEFVGTFMLCMTVLMTAVYKGSVVGNLAPLAIGLSVFFAHLIGIPITNCSINPARSFGAACAASWLPYMTAWNTPAPAITEAWEQMLFFWAVPIAGGLVAAGIFHCGFLSAEEDNDGADQPKIKESAISPTPAPAPAPAATDDDEKKKKKTKKKKEEEKQNAPAAAE